MLSKLFHKKITQEKRHIPQDPKKWPLSWNTILFKEYPRLDNTALPKDILDLKNLGEVLQSRMSAKNFDVKKEISSKELSTILYYAASTKGQPADLKESTQKERDGTRRFYPSGGRRYPLEVYLMVKRVSGIEPGIYHYNIPKHSLEQLLKSESLKEFNETPYDSWVEDAAVVFIITTVWNRNFIKYGNLGYNIILIEAGHMSQNFLLVSEYLRVHHLPFIGFNTQKVNALLDIDEDDESTLFMVALGK